MPLRSVNVPVGPSDPMTAIATMASVPSVTVCVPEFPFRSVAVYPGSTTLMRSAGRALAYWVVSMISALLLEQ